MKRGYLVLGPESTGTRMWTRVLMSCGCWGDDGHGQRLDRMAVPKEAQAVVWRRSLPHGGQWPDIVSMVGRLREAGYTVRALVCTRDWSATLLSQVGNSHAQNLEMAEENLRRAYPYAFTGLQAAGVPFVVASYESLVRLGPVMLAPLLARLGLTMGSEERARWGRQLYDGNAKYYEGKRPPPPDRSGRLPSPVGTGEGEGV